MEERKSRTTGEQRGEFYLSREETLSFIESEKEGVEKLLYTWKGPQKGFQGVCKDVISWLKGSCLWLCAKGPFRGCRSVPHMGITGTHCVPPPFPCQ
jgi:hypothetical protein